MNLYQTLSQSFRCSLALYRQNSLRTVYSSSIGLDKLYPGSSLKLTTPKGLPEDPKSKFNGFIPLEELSITYSHSSGPGGQSVNNSNTKVDLRFQVASAKWLHEDVRNELQQKHTLSKEGYLIIKSDKTRSQQLNLADALDKLRTMIRAAARPPQEISAEATEKLRRQREKAARERLIEKRMKSFTKSQRNAPLV